MPASAGRTGYSLIELLVVLTIIAIVASFVMPNLVNSTKNLRMESAAQQLIGDLNRSKIEALKYNVGITFDVTGTTTYDIDSIGARELPEGVAFGSASPDTVRFASFGPVLTGASTFYLVLSGDTTKVALSGAGYADIKK